MLLNKGFLSILLLPVLLFGQTSDPVIGDGIYHTFPIGTKIIDVGFVRNDFVNMHYVNYTHNLYLRWRNNRWKKETAGYEIEICIPKKPNKFEWSGYKKDIGLIDHYLVRVSRLDYAFRLRAYDKNGKTVRYSQIRYIRQKAKGEKR